MNKILFILLIPIFLIVSACKTYDWPKTFNVQVQGDAKETKIKIIRPFNQEERELATKALNLVSQIDTNQVYPSLPVELCWGKLPGLYGVTMNSKRIGIMENGNYGMITNRLMVIADELMIKDINKYNLIAAIRFGSILSHESHHYFYESSDPETHLLTDNKILNLMRKNPDLLNHLKY